MRNLTLPAGIVLAGLAMACASTTPDVPWLQAVPESAVTGSPVRISGRVEHSELEGGFYLIRAVNGTAYDPVNLPDEFQEAGLQVEADVLPQPGAVSTRQVGTIVQVIRIRREKR